jgi:diketogulonate reductase-like aldo/keto reductase
MPYLCHVNLLTLIMFKTNQPKETMIYRGYEGIINNTNKRLEILKDNKLILTIGISDYRIKESDIEKMLINEVDHIKKESEVK